MSTLIKLDKGELKKKQMKLMPGGPRSRTLIESVNSGSLIYIDPQNNLRLMPRDENRDMSELIPPDSEVRAFNEGWVAYFQSKDRLPSGDRLVSLKATWQVPPEPELTNDQTLYLFNAVQTTGTKNAILQPVLQWSTDEDTGEKFWSVASYCVTSTRQAKHTPFIRVNPGQALTGLIKFVRMEGSSMVFSVEFSNIQGTKLFISSEKPMELFFNSFELYDLSDCRELPDTNKTEFINVELKTKNGFNVRWLAKDNTNACGLGCTVDGGKLVVFY